MAKIPFNANLKSGRTFTVPAGKHAVFNAFLAKTGVLGHQGVVTIGGVAMGFFDNQFGGGNLGGTRIGPLTAGEGEVIALNTATNSEVGISGFIYDN